MSNILEVVSDEVEYSGVAWVKWVAGQVWDGDFGVDSCNLSGITIIGINQKLIVGLVEKNSWVSTGNYLSALKEPSVKNQCVKPFLNVNLEDVISLTVFINNCKEFSIDIEFKNSGDSQIFRELVVPWVDSCVNGKVVKVELAGFSIVDNDQDKVWKNGSKGCNFLDDDIVLEGIDENDWIVSLEDEIECFEVFVQYLDFDFAIFVVNCGFIVMGGINFDKYFLFVFGLPAN